MKIESASPSQLKVTWPRLPKPTHDEVIRRLKLINGAEFDRAEKCWWVPATQGDKLMDAFPRASFDVDAIWLCTDAAAGRAVAFYDALVALGVKFEIAANGAISAVGEGVSPLIQQLVAERATALLPLVTRDLGKPRRVDTPVPLQGPQSLEDRKWESWLTGVQSAAKREEDAKARRPRRRKAKRPQQRGLGI